MAQAAQLVDLAKRALRERGVTYAQLAMGLGVSESSVKRLFSRRKLSLERLEQICAHMGLEISDLLDVARAAQPRVTELTDAQEKALVTDERLLLVGLLVMSGSTAAQIASSYRLGDAEVVRLLVKLEKLGIIDLMPENRIKLRLARDFSWRKDGPLERFFESRVQAEFFRSSFHGPGESRFVMHGSLSERSNAILRQRMARLAAEFASLVEEDRHLDAQPLSGTTLVAAIRPWELHIFDKLRRRA
jgi:DNA-binding Xre family transcriptional regulator